MSVLERVREVERVQGAVEPGAASLRGARERLKADLVDRLGLDAMAGMLAGEGGARARAELSVALESALNTGEYEDVALCDRASLVDQVLDEVCGLGPIQPLLEDDSITEVMINGCDALFYERGGEICQAETRFDSPEQIMIAIDRILAPLGRRLDRASPLVSARLPNGDRVNAVADPISIDGPSITIRKFSDRAWTLRRLVGLGALPAWYATLLSWAVRTKCGIAVAGGTGSGKTTLLNALSCEIGPRERIVTIEDSAELRFDSHLNVVRLEARDASIEGTGEVTIRDLVKNALRMRPDRIVVGEVRGEECIDMLQAMNTGHEGSLTTLHAGSAEEAVLRLVLMARFGMDLPTELIEEQIATAVDLIVMARRLPSGKRVMASASLVGRGRGSEVVELEEIVSFDQALCKWTLLAEPPFVERGVRTGPSPGRRWRHGGLRSDGRGGFCRNRCGAGPGGGSAPGRRHRPGRQGAAAQGVGGTCPPGVNPGRPGSVAPAWVGLGGEKGQGLRCPRRGHARRGPGSGAPAAGRGCLRDVLGAAVLVDRRGCCGNAGRGVGAWGMGGAREVGSVEGACAGDARRLQDAFGCHGLGPDACAGGRVRGGSRARPGRGAVRKALSEA